MKNDDDKPDRPDVGPNDPGPKGDATEQMLVVYLDGELGEAERQAFESRLESDPALRRRLDQLRQAWDLLDELESCAPSQRFAETTLEMVAIDAEVHLKEDAAKKRRARRRRRNWIGLGFLAAMATGFAAIWFLYPSRDAVLIKDLPVIVKLDQYESSESVEFLEALVETQLFPVAPKPLPKSTLDVTKAGIDKARETIFSEDVSLEQTPPIPSSAKLRREWVKQLEPVQKDQLLRHWERFERLSPEQRRKIFTLHAELAKSDQTELLTRVMSEYSKWLRRQPSFTRTGLLDLSVSERIAKLRTLRRDELDRRGLQKWLQVNKEKLKNRAAKISQPPEGKRQPPRGSSSFPRYWQGYRGWSNNPAALLMKLQREGQTDLLTDLKGYLSTETAKEWDSKSLNWQRRWIYQMVTRMMLEEMMERHISAKTDTVNNEELAKFFERLTPSQQTELLSAPGDQLRKKLIELYRKSPTRHGSDRGHNRGHDRGPKYRGRQGAGPATRNSGAHR